MNRHRLDIALLSASSALALAVAIGGPAAAATCAKTANPTLPYTQTANTCVEITAAETGSGNVTSTGTVSATGAGASSAVAVTVAGGANLTGNVINTGNITAVQAGLRVGGTLNGEVINAQGATITLTGTNDTYGIDVGLGATSGSLINNGTIIGAGPPPTISEGFNVNTGTVNGNIVNNGLITIHSTGAIQVINGSTVTGSVINNGTIQNSNPFGAGIYLYDTPGGGGGAIDTPLAIDGSVANGPGANITAGEGIQIFATSNKAAITIGGNVSNAGSIVASNTGIQVGSATVDGAVVNSGNISTSQHGIEVFNMTTNANLSGTSGTAGPPNIKGGVINSGNITTTGAGFAGIEIADANVAGVTNAAGGVIVASKGDGIHITNTGQITFAGGTVFSSGNGPSIITGNVTNNGTISAMNGIVVDGGSTVTGAVVNTGTVGGAVNGVTINAGSIVTGGVVNSGNISGGTIGVELLNGGNFSQTAGVTTGNMVGVLITGAAGNGANATVSGGTVTSGNGTGIDLVGNGGNDTVTLSGAAVVSGLGNATAPVILLTNSVANTTSTVTIGAGATVEATGGSPTGLAIVAGNATTPFGSLVVNDSGDLIGDIIAASLVGNGTAGNISNTAVNVLAGGAWHTSGTSTLGNGAFGPGNTTVATDTISTAGTGLIGTTGNTTFVFGNTTKNTFSNGGITRVGEDGAPATLTLSGPAIALSNSGLIDLSQGAAGTDSLVGTTTAFTGVAGGVIATKAQLGGVGSIASVLTVATTAGANNIRVVDGGGTAGMVPISSGGIVLVHTGSATGNGAAFTLDPNSSGYATFGPTAQGLVKGLWLYTLANTGQNEVLVSQAGPGAFEAPIVATAAQDIFYATGPWQDRQADLRDSVLLSPGDLGAFTPGFWITAVGDWSSRTDKIDPPAGFTFDLDYRQDTYGIVAGIDGATRIGGGVGLIGVAGGYLSSQVDFDNHTGLADQNYDGGTASIYATYLQDQFFIDGQIKGDFLTLRANAFGGSGSTSVDTYGGQVEAGYRIPIGMATLEPVGTLAYAQTDIGNTNVLGTVVRYGANDSFRGAIGGRFSMPVITNDSYLVKLALDARVWDEFDGNNRATLISSLAGTPVVGVNDNFSGVFGEVGGALNLYSKGWPLLGLPERVVQVQVRLQRRQDCDRLPLPVGAPPPPPPPPPRAAAASRRRHPRRHLRPHLRRLRRPWPRTSWSTSRSISMC